jgi:integrase
VSENRLFSDITEGAMEETGLVKAGAIGSLGPVLRDSARAYAAEAKAPATRRAYRSSWAAFASWCASQNVAALPSAPETVALYVTARADVGAKVATLSRALVAISQVHKATGVATPTSNAVVLEVMKGIRRKVGVAPVQKAPVLVAELKAMLQALPEGLRGVRDRALLLVGFAGAFRRSELVSLAVADLSFTSDGLEITLRRSKTDQESLGRKIGIPFGSSPHTCPVRSVRAWLDGAGIADGPVFRDVSRRGHVGTVRLSDKAVARLVKRAAKAAGLDPAPLSGHSLRAGLATSAAKAGKSERAIMNQTGHRSEKMVRRYIRDASLFAENAAAGLL